MGRSGFRVVKIVGCPEGGRASERGVSKGAFQRCVTLDAQKHGQFAHFSHWHSLPSTLAQPSH